MAKETIWTISVCVCMCVFVAPFIYSLLANPVCIFIESSMLNLDCQWLSRGLSRTLSNISMMELFWENSQGLVAKTLHFRFLWGSKCLYIWSTEILRTSPLNRSYHLLKLYTYQTWRMYTNNIKSNRNVLRIPIYSHAGNNDLVQ